MAEHYEKLTYDEALLLCREAVRRFHQILVDEADFYRFHYRFDILAQEKEYVFYLDGNENLLAESPDSSLYFYWTKRYKTWKDGKPPGYSQTDTSGN
jgi:hypothetical protein